MMAPEDGLARWTSDVLSALISGAGGVFTAPPGLTDAGELVDAAIASGAIVVRADDDSDCHLIAGGSLLLAINRFLPTPLAAVPLWRLLDHNQRLLSRMIVEALDDLARDQPVLIVSPPSNEEPVIAEVYRSLSRRQGPRHAIWAVMETTRISPTDAAASGAHGREPVAGTHELPAHSHALVALAAVAPVALSVEVLSVLMAISETEVRANVRAAVERGQLWNRGELVLPANRLTSEEAEQRLSPAVRIGLRREIVGALRDRGVPAAFLLGEALTEGTNLPASRVRSIDTGLREMAVDAMHELKDVSPREAIQFGEHAMSLFPDDDDPRMRPVADSLLMLLWQTSQTQKAVEVVARVFIGRTNDELDAHGMVWLARIEPLAKDALRLAEEGLTLAAADSATHIRLRALRMFYLARLGFDEIVSAEAPEALVAAAFLEDSESLGLLHLALSSARMQASHFDEARALAGVAVARLRSADIPLGYWGIPALWQGHVHHLLGDSAGALTLYDDVAARANTEGKTVVLRPLAALRASVEMSLGRLDHATSFPLHPQDSDAPRIEDRMQSVAIRTKLHAALFRGDREMLAEVDELLAPPAAGNDDAAVRRATWRLLLAEELEQEHAITIAASELRASLEHGHEVLPWTDPEDDVFLMQTCVNLKYSDLAERCLRSAKERKRQNPQAAIARAIAAHVEGLMFSRPDQLRTAAALWQRLTRPLLEADALASAGELSERLAARSGVPDLESAHRLYYRAGATRRAARMRRQLRASGRTIRQSPTGETHGSRGLTWMEEEIVERAVLGPSMTRIAADLLLSRHTVVAHLRSVYIKLGISSRDELRRWHEAASPRGDAMGPDDLDHLLS
ncbi:LuxR C-terminal-related transcriptional regulator [Microbacterium sp. CGR1]|uniref:helix-turn-helix transcriptional regulator n=1 Tax=Microbacterium sp. CGR1 TaxID=1696072 RepID=UPI003DA2048A